MYMTMDQVAKGFDEMNLFANHRNWELASREAVKLLKSFGFLHLLADRKEKIGHDYSVTDFHKFIVLTARYYIGESIQATIG